MFKRIAITIVLLVLFIVSMFPEQTTNAWANSSIYNVIVNITMKRYPPDFARVDCTYAMLILNDGLHYVTTISNPWLSNNCSLIFKNMNVTKNGYYTIYLKYKVTALIGEVNYAWAKFTVYLQRPPYATLTRSKTIYY